MPKEVISSSRASSDARLVQVGWGDMAVQLGTLAPDGGSPDGRRGEFADLDRDGINRLIKVLRRARDSAFGEDA